MKSDVNKPDEHEWPRQALREICAIRRLGRLPIDNNKHQTVRPDPGDILLVQAGDVFRAGVCDGSELKIGSPFAIIRANEKAVPEFLAKVLERKSFFNAVKSMSDGTYGRIHILLAMDIRGILERISVAVPPIDEQVQIVLNSEKYISHIQKLAANFRRMAETMDKLHISMTEEMLRRKMEKKEIGQILSDMAGFFPRGSADKQEAAADDAEAAAKPRGPSSP